MMAARGPRAIPDVDLGGSDGVPIALAHANGFPPGAYRGFADALAPLGHIRGICQRPLWPGEPWADIFDWRFLGDDLLAWLDERWPDEPVLGIGHSLGGVAMLYAAVRRPERFRGLVLVEPVFIPRAMVEALPTDAQGLRLRLPLVQGALQRRDRWPDRAAAFAHLRPKPVFARFGDRALWDYVASGTAPISGRSNEAVPEVGLVCPREWEARIYATPPTDVWDLLPALTVPTLALRGALTDTIFPEAWAQWQRLQPGATFVELPGLGHLLPLEDGAAVARVVGGWLKKLGD